MYLHIQIGAVSVDDHAGAEREKEGSSLRTQYKSMTVERMIEVCVITVHVFICLCVDYASFENTNVLIIVNYFVSVNNLHVKFFVNTNILR